MTSSRRGEAQFVAGGNEHGLAHHLAWQHVGPGRLVEIRKVRGGPGPAQHNDLRRVAARCRRASTTSLLRTAAGSSDVGSFCA